MPKVTNLGMHCRPAHSRCNAVICQAYAARQDRNGNLTMSSDEYAAAVRLFCSRLTGLGAPHQYATLDHFRAPYRDGMMGCGCSGLGAGPTDEVSCVASGGWWNTGCCGDQPGTCMPAGMDSTACNPAACPAKPGVVVATSLPAWWVNASTGEKVALGGGVAVLLGAIVWSMKGKSHTPNRRRRSRRGR